MIDLRTLLAATALMLLVPAFPANGQVIVHRGVNPWTGHPYRNVVVRDPWTGRVGTSTVVVNPWTGHSTRYVHMGNPWVGRGVYTRAMYNPWVGHARWGPPPRRGRW
jgi:hypothetical protein